MEELLSFITAMAQSGTDAGSLVRLFNMRLNAIYGSCGVALVSNSGLAHDQCQVTVFVDENNKILISEDNLGVVSKNLPIYHNQGLHQLLNAAAPSVIRGSETIIKDTFGELFQHYDTVVSLPLHLPQGVHKWIFLLFLQPTNLQPVDIERILLIATLATNLGVAAENTRQLQQANQWIADELNSVAKIQRQLLPQDFSATAGLNIATRFEPYGQVGGDYYDIVKLTPYFQDHEPVTAQDKWGFMIADASGHGSAAAVEIAMFDAILRTYPPDIDAGPAGVFNYANQHLFTRTIRGSFITAFASAYLPHQGILSYCNAGHPPPILKPQAHPRDLLYLDELTGIPLGVNPDGQWHNATVNMHPGDTLVLYTDGLIEAVSESGKMFGKQRLESIIADSGHDPGQMLQNIETALLHHQENTRQNDDQTLLILQAIAETG